MSTGGPATDGPDRADGGDRVATLLTHRDSNDMGGVVAATVAMASERGWRLVAYEEEAAKHGYAVTGIELVEELPEAADLCIVLGGDGSILRALRHHAGTATPVFGVNFGTVGFLAAVERDVAEAGIARALDDEPETVDLPALSLSIGGRAHLAFNDVTFTRRPHSRVAELFYRIAGEEVGHVTCDGLVVATPTGSTGYNLANHGPILAWGVAGYVVSYIAPHTLTGRALVVAPEDVLQIGNVTGSDTVEVAIDGVPIGELAGSEEAEVRFRPASACLAQLPGTSFYHRIREKFGHLAV